MSNSTPGALSSHLLEERPACYPTQLYVHGGHPPTSFTAVVFEESRSRFRQIDRPEQLRELKSQGQPIWLRVAGLSDRERIVQFLNELGVPEILLPPLLDVPQRPRVDCLGAAVVVVLHRLGFAKDHSHLISSQVGFLLLSNLLITFEEAVIDEAFPELTDWLATVDSPINQGDHGQQDLDDILHFLVDELLNALFPMLEQIANRLDSLEEAALQDPKPKLLLRAFGYRTNIRTIRRIIWPLRSQIQILLRQRHPLLGRGARVGFREMGEMVHMLFDNCELLRHQCDAITQTYEASVGNRMNQVMKTLTILTSIFAPLTFIVGVYGMNFENMPELKWRYGYAYSLILMSVIALIQGYWLWRRGWFADWTNPRS